jgi:hypothetical protein
VMSDCQTYAVAIREPFGIWGGMTETDRKQVATASAAR